MISNLIAFYISQRLQREPIYAAVARQDGLHLPHGDTSRAGRQSPVTAAIRPSPRPFPATLSVAEAHRRAADGELGSWPVSDDEGLVGVVRVSDLASAVHDGRGDEPIVAVLSRIDGDDGAITAHVHPDQPLAVALTRMGETGHTALPVVSRANARHLLGVVTLGDILAVYGLERRSRIAKAREGTRASA